MFIGDGNYCGGSGVDNGTHVCGGSPFLQIGVSFFLSSFLGAHKLLPSAGQSSICAMQDAVVLANPLFEMTNLKHESIQEAPKDYKKERWAYVKLQYKSNKMNAIILSGQVWFEQEDRDFYNHSLNQILNSFNYTVKPRYSERLYCEYPL
jgi:hypothetical protein